MDLTKGEQEVVRRILTYGYAAVELHAEIERAVDWIEAHPHATEYQADA